MEADVMFNGENVRNVRNVCCDQGGYYQVPNKSCNLDPLPNWLLTKRVD